MDALVPAAPKDDAKRPIEIEHSGARAARSFRFFYPDIINQQSVRATRKSKVGANAIHEIAVADDVVIVKPVETLKSRAGAGSSIDIEFRKFGGSQRVGKTDATDRIIQYSHVFHVDRGNLIASDRHV